MGRQTPLVRPDIAFKHAQMAVGSFPFLAGTTAAGRMRRGAGGDAAANRF